jgi:hypothetical protein
MPVRHASVRCSAVASQAFGVQRSKARVRPERGGHGAGERVILEVDLRHCRQQGDRVGDGADEAVLLEEAASNETQGDHLKLPRKSLCEPDALRACDSDATATSAAVKQRGRRYMLVRSTSLPIDGWIAPSREFPDKSLQEYPKRKPPRAAGGRLCCAT